MALLSRIGKPAHYALISAAVVLCGFVMFPRRADACPFCSAVSLTFSEEIANSQVAVIAKLAHVPPRAAGDAAANSSIDAAKAKFEIVKVLKGEDALGKSRTFEAIYFGESPVGTTFLVMGIDPPQINWGTPIAVTDRGVEYVTKAMDLPKDGSDRLAFFQDYLEDGDEMLARDAYDEFAKMPYAGVLDLKSRMAHDKVVAWVKNPQIPVSRRRLYLTMLGVCGTPQDLPLLEEMIQSKDRQTKGALDALVAAYLNLKGADGMKPVEDLYLKNKDAEYTDTYATIMALRFHGTEEKIVPRARLLEGIRTMLERPQLADLVIPDLARWEDWSVVDRLVELFKNADEESSWVRVPVINYLRACPLPVAKERLDELAKLDPETFKRANTFFPFAGAAAAGGTAPSDTKTTDDAVASPSANAPAKDEDAKNAPASSEPPPAATDTKTQAPATKAATAPGGAGLKEPLSKDAGAVAIEPVSNLPVFGGLVAAAAILGCAFWIILKGGQRTAS